MSVVEREPLLPFVWVTHSQDETFRVGVEIGRQLTGGEVIFLSGPLGAGKTALVKGIAFALELEPDEVTSPSFTLVNPYNEGRFPFYHIDLYRLDEGPGAAHAVDLEELLIDESAVVAIEWAERMGNYPLPCEIWRINIEGAGDEPRRISLIKTEST